MHPLLVEILQTHQLVPVIAQGVLEPLHHGKDLLLLQPATHHLHAHGQAVHALGVVVLVRPARDPVELLDVEGRGKPVEGLIDVGDGEDAGRVVEL